ncbi:uncharacterized protein LOC120631100 isoform X2 [Pararge aegeria]|uniref:uncharacterized protein LOC120631100 isoform X2 n=1 Tax=Pararge aegeria TaxID=116150 RepID=UPI0019D08717|nr:uncharacterized protein LOC120631100 isoform X2 [Pararge aegeria]
MDNPLTPNKIQRLMHFAEDKSFSLYRKVLTNDEAESNVSRDQNQNTSNQTGTNCASSGILDLEHIEGFGESGLGSISLSKSSAFNPGEMTGRSTEADNANNQDPGSSRAFEEYGRHSMSIDNITNHMDKQTCEIQDLMRHSIATNYSFHSKKDLTAAEASYVLKEGRLPIQQSTQINIQDSMSLTAPNISAYFKNRCPEIGNILGHTDSPDRPSITEVSSMGMLYTSQTNAFGNYKMDQTLDCVPVRQPRVEKANEKSVATNLFPSKGDSPVFAVPKSPKTVNEDVTAKTNAINSTSKGPTVGTGKTINQNASLKPFMNSAKPADVLLRNLHSNLHMVPDDTETSMENSLSISKIADYLGKESNISVSAMLQLNNRTKQVNRKQPLTELQVNILENKDSNKDIYVTNLRDTKNADTASSSGTVNTVISLDKLKISEKEIIPSVIVTRHSANAQNSADEELRSPRMTRSKSPSSKSQSTLSTVQENIASFKSGDSPLSISKEQWAEITTSHVEGFVGVSVAVSISVKTLTDSWLTARFEFDDPVSRDLTIELPRFPLLLSPRKTENFTIYVTSNIEMDTYLPFTLYLKDSSIDGDAEYKGNVDVNFKLPEIQALSCDGVNKVTFPPIQEKSSLTKHFVLISDCPVDLQLELSIPMGESMFVIKSVQEIKKNDVSKVLMDRSGCVEEGPVKNKKGINKQLCRLSSGNAIKVAITFTSPKLSELEMNDQMATFNGTLSVAMIGINTVLKAVSLIGSVGSASLAVQPPVGKLLLSNEPTILNLCNTGTITGVWAVKFRCKIGTEGQFPFKVSANKVEIHPGSVNQLKLVYFGPHDTLNEGTLILEETSNGNIATIEIAGGSDRPKSFPIKTNYNNMSWVRAGRKELSLKNSTNQRIQIRCQIMGDGFMLDSPGVESRGTYVLSFGPCECRPLPVVFAPNSCLPHAAALHLVFDKNSDYSRKIKLHGCASNDSVRWSGLMTYGDTALVRAVSRSNIELKLFNKSSGPAFLSARVHFNLQYRFISADAELVGQRRVMGRRSQHTVVLRVPWPKLERRARSSDVTALATVTILTGPEFTRRRILRILKNESNGAMDVSLLPEHLRVLAEPFDGEDAAMDSYLEEFNETKASLNELIEGLQELTAQIDLPQDLAEDHTILITDDTVVEHHTLCD